MSYRNGDRRKRQIHKRMIRVECGQYEKGDDAEKIAD